jgi:glutaredoxin
MTEVTIYAVPPVHSCAKIADYLKARGVDHRLVTIDSDAEFEALKEKSGRLSCPIVYVGDHLVGGAKETMAAYQSGDLERLTEG